MLVFTRLGVTRARWLGLCALLTCVAGLALLRPAQAAVSDPLEDEARRLEASAQARRASPLAAVDWVRLDALSGWLAPGRVEAALARFTRTRGVSPSAAAYAEWLLRERALRRLDATAAQASARRLGLIDAFVWRVGPPPGPMESMTEGTGWQTYPQGAGAGELWMDAFARPALDTEVTLATRLASDTDRGAVLRLGYDDEVTVWLNGDEVYGANATHAAALDQVAVPVRLRSGSNRMVVRLRQQSGAWRLVARVTDARGAVLPGVTAHADPFGEVPAPSEGPRPDPEAIESVWAAVEGRAHVTPATSAEALATLEHVDLALALRLPDRDQVLQLVAAEAAFGVQPSPRALRAWLRLVSEGEQAGIRAAHVPPAPLERADVLPDLFNRLDEAWAHYHGRRFVDCRGVLDALERDAPGFLPALRLRSTLLLEIGLPNQAVSLLDSARRRLGAASPPILEGAYREALRAAGRTDTLRAALEALVNARQATPDDVYQLANLLRTRGDEAGALALLDRISAARPELWGYVLEAAEMRQLAGDHDGALDRLRILLERAPDEPSLHERIARVLVDRGRLDEATRHLRRALEIDPAREETRRYLEAVARPKPFSPPGPPLDALTATAPVTNAPAQVLLHHARVEVAPSGLATRQVRRVVRLLTAEGARSWGTWELPYTPGTQRLDVLSARRLRLGAPPASPTRSDRDLSLPEYRLYFDQRAEVLTFPRPEPGDVLDVTWRVVDLAPDPAFPGYFGDLAWLQETLPRAISVLEVASALPLTTELVSRDVFVRRDDQEGTLRFEAVNVPGVEREADMPGASSARAYVHLSSLRGWSEVDRRYRALMARRETPDERVAAAARAAVEGEDTPREKVARLYQRVSNGVRYVGLEMGKHSYQPEQPAVTLARAYGDCKDKATLLIAMARAVDIPAHIVLVRTRPQGALSPATASFAAFDHALVYFPTLDAFVDPTQDRNDAFSLPPPDQDAFAFVVGFDAAPRRLPLQPAAAQGESLALDAQLGADGEVRGTLVWTLVGGVATQRRIELEAPGTRAERAQRALAARFPGMMLEGVEAQGLMPAVDPVVVRARFRWPGQARVAGIARVPVTGAAWGLVDALAGAATRHHPLMLESARHRVVEVTLRPPAGRTLSMPRPASEASPFGRFSLDVSAASPPGTIRLVARLDLDVAHVEASDYPAFRSFLRRVEVQLGEAVVGVVAGGGP